jgi:hypothetical protein
MIKNKSKLLYLEHLLIKQLLTEQQTSSGLEKRIIDAMKSQKVVKFFYEPPSDPEGGVKAYRDVEIFALGTNRWGRRVIYAWLRSETSKTLKRPRANDRIRWRMFRLDGITQLKYTISNFSIDDAFLQRNRQKLNKKFNKALTNVTTIFDFQMKK